MPQVLLLWLVSTMAPAMQQCCEAIAEAVPHHHTPAQPSTDTQHSGHAHEHGPVSDTLVIEEHEHCPTASADISGMPILELTSSVKWDHGALVSQPWSPMVLKPLPKALHKDNTIWIINRRSTYLDTLRLRV
ncbi:hypothetical protein [Sulfuriflexus mobilis]|uniref:hypothetical protein n=1 Tax=Sulfuriflexus mobilis TaxID=1811807 RepID=UPI000F8470F4|nr:hypothetical protein [Sulfuriflexus mobilis]